MLHLIILYPTSFDNLENLPRKLLAIVIFKGYH